MSIPVIRAGRVRAEQPGQGRVHADRGEGGAGTGAWPEPGREPPG